MQAEAHAMQAEAHATHRLRSSWSLVIYCIKYILLSMVIFYESSLQANLMFNLMTFERLILVFTCNASRSTDLEVVDSLDMKQR